MEIPLLDSLKATEYTDLTEWIKEDVAVVPVFPTRLVSVGQRF